MESQFERLKVISNDTLRRVNLNYVRPYYDTISWENSSNALIGPRGVGKTTLILQRMLRLGLPPEQSIYIDLGDVFFQDNRLLDFAMFFVKQGGRYLFIDEVHRYGYGTWAQEIKQIYDLYRGKLSVTFTGSSAIKILKQNADLSRRVLRFYVPGLSFREYLQLKEAIELPVVKLADLLNGNSKELEEIITSSGISPTNALRDYWRMGYYPFFLEEAMGYTSRLNNVVQLVLDTDIPHVVQHGGSDYQKLGRLLYSVASSVPFKPNVSKLAERLGIGRDTLLKYLRLLEQANLLISLKNEARGVSGLGKPDKIYLNNPNLLYALAPNQNEVGTLRETFFVNQLYPLTELPDILPPEIKIPKSGDFVWLHKDDRYVFEIGGPNKTFGQIGKAHNHYVVTDSEYAVGDNRIPLWYFGLLY